MSGDGFYLKVAHALSGCQLVEQELKLYITEALDLVRKCINGKMPFNMTGVDYENSSLERLIKVFRKLSNNDALYTDLNRFKTERNFLSHRGISHCLDCEGELSHLPAFEFEERLVAIQAEAVRLRAALHEEANQFRGYLWFEDLSMS